MVGKLETQNGDVAWHHTPKHDSGKQETSNMD